MNEAFLLGISLGFSINYNVLKIPDGMANQHCSRGVRSNEYFLFLLLLRKTMTPHTPYSYSPALCQTLVVRGPLFRDSQTPLAPSLEYCVDQNYKKVLTLKLSLSFPPKSQVKTKIRFCLCPPLPQ